MRALFPLNGLPKALDLITKVDPLSYGVDGLRTTLIGASHFGIAVDATVLCLVTVVLLVIGSRLFSKIQL
jgi:ABC-2 type transport system permease protein